MADEDAVTDPGWLASGTRSYSLLVLMSRERPGCQRDRYRIESSETMPSQLEAAQSRRLVRALRNCRPAGNRTPDGPNYGWRIFRILSINIYIY